jgi:hypothetical protein
MEHTVRPRSTNNNTNPAPITSAIFAGKRLVVSHLPVIGPKFPGGPRRSLDRWQIIHIVQRYPKPMKIRRSSRVFLLVLHHCMYICYQIATHTSCFV